MPTEPALTHFAARAGDHNDLAMAASPMLAACLAARLHTTPTVIGEPQPALAADWSRELDAARPALEEIADRYAAIYGSGRIPVTALGRCAVALATLPVVARHHPDAAVVWFDAHADLNTPAGSATGYLGGLAFAGPLGLWDSGLGAGLDPRNAILVGARDLDAPERRLIEDGAVTLVPVADDLADRLRTAIDGRPVYVHLDCDVLEPGTVPTDYRVPGGMTLAQLRDCAAVLAEHELVGIEIGELEIGELEVDDPRLPTAVSGDAADRIVAALEPILEKLLDPLTTVRAAGGPAASPSTRGTRPSR